MCNIRGTNTILGRGGRVAEGAPLLREYGLTAHRGFESHPLRSWSNGRSAFTMVYTEPRRGGRVVECTGLENQRTAGYRGFESLPLRIVGLQTEFAP